MTTILYTPQEKLKPYDLVGISQEQIDDHWKLYVGYVNQSNALVQELDQLRNAGQTGTLSYADRRRRLGFEYNGMVLHEYYFANIRAGQANLTEGNFKKQCEKNFGSIERWQEDFAAAGKTRGIGWAILYCDLTTGALTNHFIQEHENGTIAGFAPLLVMDVWEHAYMVDHKAGGRADYINAFLKNIAWSVCEERYEAALEQRTFLRF